MILDILNPFKSKTIFKSKTYVTAEVIHKEFDAAINLLKEKTTLEDKELRKNKLLQETGFTGVKTFKLNNLFKEEQDSQIACDFMNETLKLFYPTSHFITELQLESLCYKYNLIIAPVELYAKDVPEKNLLEIVNRQEIHPCHRDRINLRYKKIITNITFDRSTKISDIKYITEKMLGKTIEDNTDRKTNILEIFDLENHSSKINSIDFKKLYDGMANKLFISAPISHFDFKNAKGVEKAKIDDPIVFEYVNYGFVRIITKWGTPDDQSYLDPIVTNPQEN
jgi:hypothetical protein